MAGKKGIKHQYPKNRKKPGGISSSKMEQQNRKEYHIKPNTISGIKAVRVSGARKFK